MSYCTYIPTIESEERRKLHEDYHDNLYGYPLHDDNELFGRLLLEINQAGLNWEIILKKADAFRKAYAGYDVAKVAAFGEKDITRLLSDAGIVRNRLKIQAAIYNANVILKLQQEYGSFENWLIANHPLTKEQWIKLFRKHFRFVGGEIVGEFLMSIGFLPDAHDEDCPIYNKILTLNPMWMQKSDGHNCPSLLLN